MACDEVAESAVSRVLGTPELLSMIFLSYAHQDTELPPYLLSWSFNTMDKHSYPQLNGKRIPLLTCICRHWRAIAITTPHLWANMELFVGREEWNVPTLSRLLSSLRTWIERSKQVPISVDLTINPLENWGQEEWVGLGPGEETAPEESLVEEIMYEIYKQSHRWKDIRFYLPDSAISGMLGGHSPLLKNLELWSPGKSGMAGGDLSLRHAHGLGELSLKQVVYMVIPDGLPESLQALEVSHSRMRLTQSAMGSKIRSLNLNFVPLYWADLAKIPSVFPLLEELTLRHIFEQAKAVTDKAEFFLLDNLLSLNVYLEASSCFPLNAIKVPALKHLKLGEFKSYGEKKLGVLDEALGLIRRSMANLVTFSYASETTAPIGKVFETILREMPDLTKLSIRNTALPISYLKLLQNPAICPNLSSLYNDKLRENRNRFGASVVLQLIKARCRERRTSTGTADGGNGGSERIYIAELALPLSPSSNKELLKSEVFQRAEIDWRNTNKCERVGW